MTGLGRVGFELLKHLGILLKVGPKSEEVKKEGYILVRVKSIGDTKEQL